LEFAAFELEKMLLHIFRAESRAPREKAWKEQEPRGTRRVEDLNRGDRAPWKRAPDPVGGRYPTREELLHPEAVGA